MARAALKPVEEPAPEPDAVLLGDLVGIAGQFEELLTITPGRLPVPVQGCNSFELFLRRSQ